MKILLIPSWFPHKRNKIWGNYFIKQAEELQKFSEVSMLNINRIGFKDIFNMKKEKSEDGYDPNRFSFKFYQISFFNPKTIFANFFYSIYPKLGYKAYKDFVKHIGKPDIIVVQSVLPAGLLAKYIWKKDGIPFVVHAHSNKVLNNEKAEHLVKSIIDSAHGYYAVSDNIRKRLIELNRNDVKIIPNFIDTKKFKITKKDNKTFNLINISNFYRVKAIDLLLKALHIVIYEKKITDIHLTIIGTGDFEQFYKDVANELNLNKYVTFTGYIPNEKIQPYLNKSHVLCVSSTEETFNIPLIEAMASGIPVISTKCGGPEEIVTKETGLLVTNNDVNAFVNGILKMKKDYNLYNPKKIKEYVYNKYDGEVVCKNFIKELENDIKKTDL